MMIRVLFLLHYVSSSKILRFHCIMQQIKDQKGGTFPPSRRWREKYSCRRRKGEHLFELVKPNWLGYREEGRRLTVEEYYKKEKEQVEKRNKRERELEKENTRPFRVWFSRVFYEWSCVACGKRENEYGQRNRNIKEYIPNKVKSPDR